MLESNLYARLRKSFVDWGTFSRVENAAEPGMWDIHYCFSGQLGWIETKVEKQGWIYFEKFQPNWGRRYFTAGADHLWIIVQRKEGQIEVHHVSALLNANREPYRKWVRVKTNEMKTWLTIEASSDMDKLRQLLTSPFTPLF